MEFSLQSLTIFLEFVTAICTGKDHPYVEIQIKYEEVVVLPIRIVKSNVSNVGSSSQRNTESRDFIAIYIGYTPTCLFLFASEHCLRKTLRLSHYIYTSFD